MEPLSRIKRENDYGSNNKIKRANKFNSRKSQEAIEPIQFKVQYTGVGLDNSLEYVLNYVT